jgi:hypothetical protein
MLPVMCRIGKNLAVRFRHLSGLREGDFVLVQN